MSALKFSALACVLLVGCGSGSSDSAASPSPSSDVISVKSQVALKSLRFSTSNLPIYLSSNYFPGVGTAAGRALFLNDFGTHNIVRVNTFDAAVVQSDSCVPTSATDFANCVAQFKLALESASDFLTFLTQTNKTKILMVNIFRTPSWLSSHADSTPACGGGTLGQSYRPKDYAVWQQLLVETATFFEAVEAASGTRIYYQFWNEPDLACNWQESTAAFLELYGQTMPYLQGLHPTAKVGGAETESWAGKVASDGASRPQNLNFDLIQFVKAHGLPMDFVSFHYFSTDYQSDFIDAVAQYRAFRDGEGYTEAQMPVVLTEWLPQSGVPNGPNPLQAIDAANLFLAFDQVNLWGQGGVPFEDYGTDPDQQWGTVTYPDATPKPIFYVYQFFDALSRANAGISDTTDAIDLDVPNSVLQSTFKVGERKQMFAQLAGACYALGAWNRIASAQDAAIAFLIGEGVTLGDLQAAYGQDPSTFLSRVITAINTSQPFDPKWTTAFANANFVLNAVGDLTTKKSFSYDLGFPDDERVSSASGQSLDRNGVSIQDASLLPDGNHLQFSLLPQEVLLARVCF